MSDVIQVLNTVLPVIIMLGIGIICRKTGMISREGIGALKNVVVNIALPAVLISAFATMTYSWKNIIITLMMFMVCLAAWFLGKIVRSIFRMKSRFVPFLCTGFEAGMLGYALFPLLYGSDKIGDFATIDLGQVLFVFTLYKILLGIDADKSGAAKDGKETQVNFKSLMKEMFTSPVVIAIIVGVLIGATGLYRAMASVGLNSVFDACTTFVSNPTGAIILLTIGYDLVPDRIPWKKVASVSVSRLVIMLIMRLAAGAVIRLIGLGDSLDTALNVMMILPPPYVLPVFADDENEREYVSASLSVLTLIAIVCFMVLAALPIK